MLMAIAGSVPACAEFDITIVLDEPFQTAAPGDELTFTGTIYNNDNSTIFLNGDGVNLTGASLSFDDSPFFSGPATIDPLDNTGDFELFTVTANIPYLDPAGLQTGTFDVQGGGDGDAQLFLGEAAFSVYVTPEPSTAILALTGIALVAVKRRSGLMTSLISSRRRIRSRINGS